MRVCPWCGVLYTAYDAYCTPAHRIDHTRVQAEFIDRWNEGYEKWLPDYPDPPMQPKHLHRFPCDPNGGKK